MAAPITEITTFTVSDAYRNSPGLDSLPTTPSPNAPGLKALYHGLQVEDPSIGYIFRQWATQSDAAREAETTVVTPGIVDRVLVQFATDCAAALQAPVLELALITLKEGSNAESESVKGTLDAITGQDTPTVHAAMWKPALQRDDLVVMLVGWESMEAHQEVLKKSTPEMREMIGNLLKVSTLAVTHVKLTAAFRMMRKSLRAREE